MVTDNRRPRDYAREIAALPNREDRRAALFQAPEHLRGLIEAHVRLKFDTKSGKLSGQ